MKKILVLSAAALLALSGCNNAPKTISWEEDLAMRLAEDFCESREGVRAYIERYIPDVTDAQIDAWTASGELENMVVDGEVKYFESAAPNLFRINKECKAIKSAALSASGAKMLPNPLTLNKEEVEKTARETGQNYAVRDSMEVTFTITVQADAVPAGETVRCWLPLPVDGLERQKNVKLISTSPVGYIKSAPDCPHNSIYLEQKAVAGEPTVFSESFSFVEYGTWFDLGPDKVLPYDTTSETFIANTREQAPHIVFSDRMKALSDSLTAGLTNPYEKAVSIFRWIDENIPWASAREYSTIANIPDYVLDVRHGDCGQQTLLMMTLLRIAGIPCHWQSGFSMTPGDEGLHDWAEVYFEGVGWVPVDQSRGIVKGSMFNFGGMDTYRMIVNQDFGAPMSPEKQYTRSETVDFQRGEVEWRGGNIYYNQRRWKIEVTHHQ